MIITIHFKDGVSYHHGEERNFQALDGLVKSWYRDGYIIKDMKYRTYYPPSMIEKVSVDL